MSNSSPANKETTIAGVLRLAAITKKLYVGSEIFAEIQEKYCHGKNTLSSAFGEIEVILVDSLAPRAILAAKPRGEA